MKNNSLFFQISFLLTMMILLIGLIISAMIPATLKTFFTNEMYRTIEESQDMTTRINRMGQMMGGKQAIRSVQHVFLDENGYVIGGRSISKEADSLFYLQGKKQKTSSKRYEVSLGNRTLFYVISKKELSNRSIFQISYMMETYRDELIRELLKKVYLILVVALLVGFLLAFLFARWLVKPIQVMKDSVLNYANRKWEEPLDLNRGDELGVLANSIEKMRGQLKEQDEAQQFLLQNVSHDLKTPVMVIRSYADALKEGIFPTGTPEGTGEIIENEAANLEKKIKNLIYLTKLDYISRREIQPEKVELIPLIHDIVNRLSLLYPSIDVNISASEKSITGNRDQIEVLLENLIENAMKFAYSKVEMNVVQSEQFVEIICFNDGESISEKIISKIYQPFVKGDNGSFGLGLAIISQIISMHGGIVKVENVSGGVQFSLKFPKY